MIRNSVKYVSYKDLKEVTSDLKKIYTAVSEEVAELELEEFAEKWDKKYPVISNMWKKNWALALNQFELLGLKYDLIDN